MAVEVSDASAWAILTAVRERGLSPRLNVDQAEVIVNAWLRSRPELELDRYGNYKYRDNPKRRYHLKKTVLNIQADVGGRWANVTSRSTIEVAQVLVRTAAQKLSDQGRLDAWVEEKKRRESAKAKRVEVRLSQEQERRLSVLSWKHAVVDLGEAGVRVLRGFADDDLAAAFEQRRTSVRVELARLPETVLALSSLKHSRHSPPWLPLYPKMPNESKDADWTYAWEESEGGVAYTVRVQPESEGSARISIGSSGGMLDVDPASMRVEASVVALRAKGDGYISGRVIDSSPEARDRRMLAPMGVLFMITAQEKRKGAGARLLSIWCDLMAGYGVNAFEGQAVGSEGAEFLRAMERRGKIDVLKIVGSSWALRCRGSEPRLFGVGG